MIQTFLELKDVLDLPFFKTFKHFVLDQNQDLTKLEFDTEDQVLFFVESLRSIIFSFKKKSKSKTSTKKFLDVLGNVDKYFLKFEYLEGEGGSDLVLRLWVGQSLAWFYTINLPNYNFPKRYYSNPKAYQAEHFRP